MSDRFAVERVQARDTDLSLLALLILLVGFGMAVVFSSSCYDGERLTGNPYHFVRKHVLHVVVGGVLAFLLSRLSLERVQRLVVPLVLFSLFLIALTFVPGIGSRVQGARRWIVLFGQSFQPSELAKFAMIVYLAHMLSKKHDRIDDLLNTVIPPLLVAASFAALVYLQNDFSTSVFLLLLCLTMFFVAGVKVIYFVFLASAAVPRSAILLLTKEHRVQRIISFLNPQVDPVGAGYQVIASRGALVRGGLWGTGLGFGMFMTFSMPSGPWQWGAIFRFSPCWTWRTPSLGSSDGL